MDNPVEIYVAHQSARASSRSPIKGEAEEQSVRLPSLDSHRTPQRANSFSANLTSRSMNSGRTMRKKSSRHHMLANSFRDQSIEEGEIISPVSRRHRPTPRYLDIVERHMVISLFKEAIERLSLIQEIGVDMNVEKLEFESRFGEEIDRVLDHQHELERRHSKLMEDRKKYMKMLSNKHMLEDPSSVVTQLRDNDRMREEIREEIRRKRDMLDQYFEKRPVDIQQYVGKITHQINTAIRIILSVMKELDETGGFQKLMDSVEEERKYLPRDIGFYLHQEHEYSDQIKNVKEQTNLIIDESRKEFHEMDRIISTLEAKISYHRKALSTQDEYVRHRYDMDIETANRVEDLKVEGLLVDQERVTKKMEMESKFEHHTLEFLLKKKACLESEKKEWVDRYDLEVGSVSGQINQLHTKLDQINEQKRIADQRYEDFARRIEAIRNHRHHQKMQVLFGTAATIIQAIWRGYIVRKRLPQAFQKRFMKRKDLKIDISSTTSPSIASPGPGQTEFSSPSPAKDGKRRRKKGQDTQRHSKASHSSPSPGPKNIIF